MKVQFAENDIIMLKLWNFALIQDIAIQLFRGTTSHYMVFWTDTTIFSETIIMVLLLSYRLFNNKMNSI